MSPGTRVAFVVLVIINAVFSLTRILCLAFSKVFMKFVDWELDLLESFPYNFIFPMIYLLSAIDIIYMIIGCIAIIRDIEVLLCVTGGISVFLLIGYFIVIVANSLGDIIFAVTLYELCIHFLLELVLGFLLMFIIFEDSIDEV